MATINRFSLAFCLLFASLGGASAAYNPQVYTVVNGAAYGMNPSATDNTGALTAAYNAAVASGAYGQVFVPCTGTYTFTTTSGLSWDASKAGLISCGATLYFSSLASNASALTVLGTITADSSYLDVRSAFANFILQGNGASGSIGLNFSSAYDIAQIGISGVGIKGFGYGEVFNNNAYLIRHNRVSIFENGVGVYAPSTEANGGENISYTDSAIFNNSGYAISLNNSAADWNFVNTSFDYNNTSANPQLAILSGEAHFVNCHVEAQAQQVMAGTPSNAFVSFINTEFVQQASGGAVPYFDLSAGSGYLTFVGGRIVPNAGTSTVMALGGGASVSIYGTAQQYGSGVISTSGSALAYTNFPPYGTATSSRTIQGNQLVTASGLVSLGGIVTIASTNTWVNLPLQPLNGLYVFRDSTSGGGAVFSGDQSTGTASIQNAIPGFAFRFSAGTFQVEVTSGTTPRVIPYGILGGW